MRNIENADNYWALWTIQAPVHVFALNDAKTLTQFCNIKTNLNCTQMDNSSRSRS